MKNFSRPLGMMMSRAPVFPRHNMFSEGRTIVEEEQRTGHDTARVRELVGSGRRLTVRMISGEVNMNL
jgi:hypothetical protein